MRRGLYLLFVVAFLGFAASASAAPTWLPPSELAAGGPLEQTGNFLLEWPPSVAVDGEGNAAVVTSRDPVPGFVSLGLSRPAGGTWGPAAELSRPGENSVAPQIAFDAAGDETAVWLSYMNSGSVIMAATRPAGGGWEEPVAVSAPGAQFGLNSLAVAPGGEATAVWTSEISEEHQVVEAASKPAGASWEEPVELSAVATGPEQSPGAGQAHVASDAAGDLTALWTFGPAAEAAVQAARKPAGGTWGEAETVSAPGTSASVPTLAVDASGDADAAWSSWPGGTEFSIESASSTAGGSWELHNVVEHTSVYPGEPGLAIGPAGEATVVWTQSVGTFPLIEAASSARGGDWGPSVRLSGPTAAGQPDVAYRGDEAVAIWREGESGSTAIETAARADDGTWGAATDISAGGKRFAETPVLAFDAEGEGVAAWYSSDGEGSAPEYETDAAGYDAVGPRLGSASIPAAGTAGIPLAFSVSPLDVWSGVGATEWNFGDGGSASGPSASHTYARPGTYEVTLRSTDLVGNVSTLTRAVAIGAAPSPPESGDSGSGGDATRPNTQAPPKPGPPRVDLHYTPNHPHHPDRSGGPRYTFHFSDPTGQATFLCRLDRAPFRPCGSPMVYRHLRRGRHTFRVKAVSPTSGSSPVRTVSFTAGRHA